MTPSCLPHFPHSPHLKQNLSAFIIRAADLNVQTKQLTDGKKKEVMLLDNRYLLYFVFILLWAVPSACVLLRVIYGARLTQALPTHAAMRVLQQCGGVWRHTWNLAGIISWMM